MREGGRKRRREEGREGGRQEGGRERRNEEGREREVCLILHTHSPAHSLTHSLTHESHALT